MPTKEARTPMSLRTVKDSTWMRAPKSRVKIEEVEVRMVDEATDVYSRQPATR